MQRATGKYWLRATYCFLFAVFAVGIVACLNFLKYSNERRKADHTSNCLREVAIAVVNYASAHRGHVPTTIESENGAELVSWRFHLAPYLDSARMDFDIIDGLPWTADEYRNWREYRQSILKIDESTDHNFVACVGRSTVWSTGKTLMEIPGDTLLITEAAPGDNWMKPNDLDIHQTDAGTIGELTGLDTKVHMAFADGTVQSFRANTPLSVLKPFFDVSTQRDRSRSDLRQYFTGQND